MDSDKVEQSENEEIKSTAIVKYSLPKPAQFTKLQCNTDLNMPPSNWLSSSADSYGLQHVLSHPKGYSSFRMAHMFPDCVGEVDVVSDAEIIKKILKIPYHKGHVSMMVHRIENTLLIDDFDIYQHFLKTAETEWEWLKKFFFENVNRATYEEDKNLFIQSRRREALKEKSLISKFLYHSLVPTDSSDPGKGTKLLQTTGNHSLPGPVLPEPAPHSECPDAPTSSHEFNRNVVWTFEDIEMLIGTDMPIFGGGTHPCISLRLRDMSKPINVLTGIDYWLDNLMSNVPEVIMCYHLNGIVQKYELIKTEDLPRMDNSKFSPKLIRDVAQSILSFLKSNATKAGHTYWLFKGKDEEVIKLYDLTSLCSEKDVEKGQNPFTIPVAMLLYRVARNMKHSLDTRQPGTIRMLLKNCLKLLPPEKYPEIVTSSLYMLSDLYVPANTNPENPDLFENEQDEDTDSIFEDDISEKDRKEEATKILVLDNNRLEKFKNYYKRPPPIVGGIEERCLQAIQHVSSGLDCLKYFPESNTTDIQSKEEEVKMAKPFEPIPMPYSKLHEESSKQPGRKNKKKDRKKSKQEKKEEVQVESKNALLPKVKNEAQPLPTWNSKVPDISWKDHLKTLLYEKAVLVYAVLSEYHFVNGHYGSSFRNIGLLARCQLIMNKLLYTSNALRENCLLGRAGDCCIRVIQTWGKSDSYGEQLRENTYEDLKMMEQLEQDERLYNIKIGNTDMKCVFIYDIRTIEQMLLKAIECYEMALKISETESILRRLGNSLNELASYYLNVAKMEKTDDDIRMTCKKAEPYLVRGLEIFEKVKDEANTALLYANIGHLHRLLAHTNTPADRGELTPQEKLHYNKAFINYKKALQVLGERHHCPGVWDAVKWELSTALFTMGSIMHENPPSHLGKSEAEKEVIEILQKALQYCDFDENNPKFPLYQYRAAIIHYRIGSLYHSHIWSTVNDSANRKNIIQLAKINYEKAAKLYFQSLDAVNYFTAELQRLALSEYLVETTSSTNTKIKHLQHCLDIVLELDEMIELLVEKKVETSEDDATKEEEDKTFKTCLSLLKLIKLRLQHILKQLIKMCSTKPPPNKDAHKYLELYKNCFKISFELRDDSDYKELSRALCKVLKDIEKEVKNFSV